MPLHGSQCCLLAMLPTSDLPLGCYCLSFSESHTYNLVFTLITPKMFLSTIIIFWGTGNQDWYICNKYTHITFFSYGRWGLSFITQVSRKFMISLPCSSLLNARISCVHIWIIHQFCPRQNLNWAPWAQRLSSTYSEKLNENKYSSSHLTSVQKRNFVNWVSNNNSYRIKTYPELYKKNEKTEIYIQPWQCLKN